MTETISTDAPSFTYRYDADGTWSIICNSDICDGRVIESGYLQFDWAVEESADHTDCEGDAVAAYNAHYGFDFARD